MDFMMGSKSAGLRLAHGVDEDEAAAPPRIVGRQRHADEAAHRVPEHVERIGPVGFGDFQEIADVAVPAVGTGRGDLAVATTT